jgi:hypothetical protein
MKVIFTLLISWGLWNAAFADSRNDGRRQQEGYKLPASSNGSVDRNGINAFQTVSDNRDHPWK